MIKIEYEGNIPSVNHYWGYKANKRTYNPSFAKVIQSHYTGKPVVNKSPSILKYVTQNGKTFKNVLGNIAKIQMNRYNIDILRGQLEVEIDVTFTSRNRDIDNITKPILDSLQGIVYKNDNQIYRLLINKNIGKSESLVIKIGGLDDVISK